MRPMRSVFLVLLLIFSAASFSSLSFAQETKTLRVAEAPSEEDQVTQGKVRSLLKEIPDFQNIFVTVKGGVVTLKGRVLELEQVTRAEELAGKIDGVVTVNNQIEVETSVEKRIAPALERFQNRVSQTFSALPIVAVGLVVFAIVTLIGFLIARMKYPWDAISPNRFLANLVRQLVRLIFIVLGMVLALDIMGATALLSTILGAAGILGLALGFAVRDTVENYIASILLSFRQPFRPRDCVEIAGNEGYVIALTSRATILLTYDGNHVRIPNATVFKGVITNFSQNPERRFAFEIGVETDDLQAAVDIGLEVIGGLSFVLEDPAPDGYVKGIGDSSMILWFGGWIDQNKSSLVKARSEAMRKIKLAFEVHGIGVPEPVYRLRFDQQVKGLSVADAKATKRKPSKSAVLKTVMADEEQDVSPDRELEQKIIEEENKNTEGDLLDSEAPREVG